MASFHVTILDHRDAEVAAAIHAVMMAAYRVEAELLGVADFPPLRRDVADISAAASQYIGICVDDALVAVAELQTPGPGRVHIASLVVRPSHFRRGLASALLRHITSAHGGADVTVATAVRNTPAVSLYAAHAFDEQHRWTTRDGIAMVTFCRRAHRPIPAD